MPQCARTVDMRGDGDEAMVSILLIIYIHRFLIQSFGQCTNQHNRNHNHHKRCIHTKWCPPSNISTFPETHPPYWNLSPIFTTSVTKLVQDCGHMMMTIITTEVMLRYKEEWVTPRVLKDWFILRRELWYFGRSRLWSCRATYFLGFPNAIYPCYPYSHLLHWYETQESHR